MSTSATSDSSFVPINEAVSLVLSYAGHLGTELGGQERGLGSKAYVHLLVCVALFFIEIDEIAASTLSPEQYQAFHKQLWKGLQADMSVGLAIEPEYWATSFTSCVDQLRQNTQHRMAATGEATAGARYATFGAELGRLSDSDALAEQARLQAFACIPGFTTHALALLRTS
jgi:hypothetical protein